MGNLHKNAQSDLCVLNNMYRGIFYVVYMKQKYHFLLCFPSTVSPWWLLFPTLLHHQLNSVLCIFLILFSVHNPLFPSSHDHKSQYQAQCKMFSCPVLENFSICCFFFWTSSSEKLRLVYKSFLYSLLLISFSEGYFQLLLLLVAMSTFLRIGHKEVNNECFSIGLFHQISLHTPSTQTLAFFSRKIFLNLCIACENLC